MKSTIAIALAAIIVVPAAMPSAAMAQSRDYRWNGDRNSDWDPARHYDERHDYYSDNARVYRGSDGRYYCKKSDGTTGLLLGAVGGGLIGNALGGGALGTILGAGGGALLGKSLDKKHDTAQNRRNGYYCR